MSSDGVVAVRVLAGIEQHAHDVSVAELCGQSHRPVTIFGIGGWEQATGVVSSP